MLKNLCLLTLVFMLGSCQKESAPAEPVQLYTFQADDNFISQDPDKETSGFIIITDQDGNLIDKKSLSSSEVVVFEGNYDLVNKVYHASVVRNEINFRNNINGNKSTTIQTITNIASSNLEFLPRVYSAVEDSPLTTVFLKLEDCGQEPRSTDFGFNGSYIFDENWSDNDCSDPCWITVRLNMYTGGLADGENGLGRAYMQWKRPDEPLSRYIWLEQPTFPGEEKEMNYNASNEFDHFTTITYPENQGVTQRIYGTVNDVGYYFEIGEKSTDDQENLSFYYPDNFFNSDFVSLTTVQQGDKKFASRRAHNEFPNQYTPPQLDFESNYTSLSNFQITSNTPYDFYKIELSQSAPSKSLDWTIQGKSDLSTDLNLSAIMAEIPEEFVIGDFENVTGNTEIYKAGPTKNLQDIQAFLPGNGERSADNLVTFEALRKEF